MCSLWLASVEDLAAWSSPASTSTPPCFAVPAELACLNTSPQRSTPGPLPYHMPKTPSYFAPGNMLSCCDAPDRGGGEVLVDAGLELDVVRGEVLLRAPQRLVEAAQRRAAVAGDEAGGVQARAQVALALQQQQPDQRLRAGEEDAAALERVLVVERDLGERGGIDRCVHQAFSSVALRSILDRDAALGSLRHGLVPVRLGAEGLGQDSR